MDSKVQLNNNYNNRIVTEIKKVEKSIKQTENFLEKNKETRNNLFHKHSLLRANIKTRKRYISKLIKQLNIC